MKPREKEYWEKATGMLSQDGPAPVPEDLAERAFRKALEGKSRSGLSFIDAFVPYAWRAALCALTAAVIPLLLPTFATTTKAEEDNPVEIVWEMSAKPFSHQFVATTILATPMKTEEVQE